MRLTVIAAIISASAAGCNEAQVVAPLADSGAAYVPAAAWRTANPAAAGFDATRMATLRADVGSGRYGGIDGLVIVRFGHVVHEQYGPGWSATRTHTLQSVSKSVTALLYGVVAGRPEAALDRKVVDVFAQYAPIANTDANKSSLMTCSVIRQITNEPVNTFARRELFEPLGITSQQWFVSPFDGLPHCGGGLNLSPPDLARIGYLVLRNGRWGDRQVVPSAWITEMTQPHTSGGPLYFSNFGSKYGYFWWLFPEAPNGAGAGVIAGSGSGGQWLFVVPSRDLVVALAASNGFGMDLLYSVLGAIR